MTTPTPPGAPELPEVVAFLNGEGPLDGVWFGGKHPTERGDFWWRKYLRAAIQQAAGAVPEGWRLVPVKPTEAMMAALSGESDAWLMDGFRADYARMLATSPAIEPPKQQPDHLAVCWWPVKVRELVEELEIAAGRITQYSNSPLDGLLQAAADALRDFAAAPSPRRVPLTADQLYANDELMALNACHGLPMLAIIEVVRTIERAHGIGPAPLQGKEAGV